MSINGYDISEIYLFPWVKLICFTKAILITLGRSKPQFLELYRGLTGGFLLLQNFCVAISVSPHVCFILVLILISMFLR